MPSSSRIADHIHQPNHGFPQGRYLPENHLPQQEDGNRQRAIENHVNSISSACLINLGGVLESGRHVLTTFSDEPEKERRKGRQRSGRLRGLTLAALDQST